MRSNRKEAFRYTFEEEIPARFTIKQIDGKEVTTPEGEAFIADISPKVLMIRSNLHIPKTSSKEIHLWILFTLNRTKFTYSGEIIWKKKRHPLNEYGMKLFTDDIERKEIVDQLKFYAKHNS